jgi:Rrf2 family protein
MKLSRTLAYALHALLQLARSETSEPISCSYLANEGQMPERFLLQVLRNLVNHGILRSTRGVDGGYALKRQPGDISLLEMIEAVDGPLVPASTAHEGLPEEFRRKLEYSLKRATELARSELRAITLAELLPAIEG